MASPLLWGLSCSGPRAATSPSPSSPQLGHFTGSHKADPEMLWDPEIKGTLAVPPRPASTLFLQEAVG